ncbi:MAG: hypothetical protein WKF55_06290 [Gemmatimonadaceae bacterium]
MRPDLRLQRFIFAASLNVLLIGAPERSGAQAAPEPIALTQGVITVSGDSVDRLRLAQLEGRAPLGGLMLRSTSSLMDARPAGTAARAFTIVFPQFTFIANSELPFGQNDGSLWAGKGANARILGGFTATLGPIRVVAIPEFAYSANNRLSINPIDERFAQPLPAGRSRFSSPFNIYPYSADMPYRFGDKSMSKISGGQSSVTFSAGPIQAGAATENEWWGPAIRNPIVMSDNAPGFPHAFLRTGRPVETFLGLLEGRWIVGGLKESDFFNDDITDDVRSLSALAVTWRRNAASGLTLGATRSVFAPANGYSEVPASAFDVLRNTGHPNARAIDDSATVTGPDQILSVFARWALPRFGLESYVEWGRAELPISPRDFFEQPNHTRGYSAGLQWVRPLGTEGSRLRIQGELTNVEQSTSYRFRPGGSFYTSRAVAQGYTNEGQLLGAGLGPGSSGQWVAGDYYNGPWQFGLNIGRIRFNNDAFFRQTYAHRCGHDVTVYPGLRASYSSSYFRFSADYASASRYNSFFQNKLSCEGGGEGSDRSNRYLAVTLTTFGF